MSGIVQVLRRWVRSTGFDVVRYTAEEHPLARTKQILGLYGVDAVIDVGANTGQYALQLREIGYKGRIISFEPVGAAYRELAVRAESDKQWDTFNYALGNTNGEDVIHVAANSYSSSLLSMLPAHEAAAPQSKYVGTEKIAVRTLDTIFDSLALADTNVLLKLDTQGSEKNVFEGAAHSLQHIDTIELEMSIEPLYEGEPRLLEMYASILEMGYQPVSIQDEFRHPDDGRLLQVQAIFHRFC